MELSLKDTSSYHWSLKLNPRNRPRTKRPKTERTKRQPQPNDEVKKEEVTITKEELIDKLKKRFSSKEE